MLSHVKYMKTTGVFINMVENKNITIKEPKQKTMKNKKSFTSIRAMNKWFPFLYFEL